MKQQAIQINHADLTNQRNAVMKTQATHVNTAPSTPSAFDYDEFNDSLAHVMRRYRALHIQKDHNHMATTLMDGKPNQALSSLADVQIKKATKMLSKLQATLRNFAF